MDFKIKARGGLKFTTTNLESIENTLFVLSWDYCEIEVSIETY